MSPPATMGKVDVESSLPLPLPLLYKVASYFPSSGNLVGTQQVLT